MALFMIIFAVVMKKLLAYLFFSIALSWVISAYTGLSVPGEVLGTLYTVAGVIFSVGMSIAISPKTDGVTNERMRSVIRSSYLRIRNSFMYIFGIGTILFIVAEVWTIKKLPAFWDVLCTLFLLISVVYYIYNFTQLQKLGGQIEDQVIKEKNAE